MPALVRGADGVGERNRDPEQLLERQAVGGDQLPERPPLDVLHREERDAVGFLDGMDGDDVRVVERGDGLRFALEAAAPLEV